MIKNYLKIAIRNLWRNKTFTAINVFGLAIGISTCLLIMLFVQNELSYDRFNDKGGPYCTGCFQGFDRGEKMKEARVMPPVAQTLKSNLSGSIRSYPFEKSRVSAGHVWQ